MAGTNELISMTDFLIEQRKELLRKIDYKEKLELYTNIVYAYANFLKQKLELWMFVPCDENGEVLEKPIEPEYPYNDKESDVWPNMKCI